MTQEQKAEKYDAIILEGDRLQRELSKVKSANPQEGFYDLTTTPPERIG